DESLAPWRLARHVAQTASTGGFGTLHLRTLPGNGPDARLRERTHRLRTAPFQGDLDPDFCLAPAFSCPVRRRTAPLLARFLAAGLRPPPGASAFGQHRQKLSKDCLLTPSAKSGAMGP